MTRKKEGTKKERKKKEHIKPLPDPPKFFNECPKNKHLDARFCKKPRLTGIHLTHVLLDLLEVVETISALTENPAYNGPVLGAGGLIGMHFNSRMLPWDDDLDFYVSP